MVEIRKHTLIFKALESVEFHNRKTSAGCTFTSMSAMRGFTVILLLLIAVVNVNAQADSSGTGDPFITNTLFYSEFYSSVELNHSTELRPDFVYSHKRLNGVAPNLILLKITHGNSRFRLNAGAMIGDYATYNLASEKGIAQQIFEANAEARLSKRKSIWLTMGIMPSHIGVESAIGLNCMTLTRSIVADNSPYYETGAKISYTSPNEKWTIAALLLNGWQRINVPVIKVQPAAGTQINFVPNENFAMSWNSYSGIVNSGFRFYNNVYVVLSNKRKISFVVSADFGVQKSDSSLNSYFSPVLLIGYKLNSTTKTTLRLESYHDPKASIIPSAAGFKANSISLNLDWQPIPNFMLRGEYKYGNSPLNNFNGESQSSLLTLAVIVSVQ